MLFFKARIAEEMIKISKEIKYVSLSRDVFFSIKDVVERYYVQLGFDTTK